MAIIPPKITVIQTSGVFTFSTDVRGRVRIPAKKNIVDEDHRRLRIRNLFFELPIMLDYFLS